MISYLVVQQKANIGNNLDDTQIIFAEICKTTRVEPWV